MIKLEVTAARHTILGKLNNKIILVCVCVLYFYRDYWKLILNNSFPCICVCNLSVLNMLEYSPF